MFAAMKMTKHIMNESLRPLASDMPAMRAGAMAWETYLIRL
jgi:hypothetical protein